MQQQPAESKENNHSRPKNPLILLRPPLNHTNRISTDPQRVRNTIQPLLRPLQDLPLLSQIPQDRLPPGQVLIQRRVRICKEGLLPQCMRLSRVVVTPHTQASILRGPWTSCRAQIRRIRVWIVRRRGVMRPPTKQLAPVNCRTGIFALQL
jgi:hypothetical protein